MEASPMTPTLPLPLALAALNALLASAFGAALALVLAYGPSLMTRA
jgi:hypothetical protein